MLIINYYSVICFLAYYFLNKTRNQKIKNYVIVKTFKCRYFVLGVV